VLLTSYRVVDLDRRPDDGRGDTDDLGKMLGTVGEPAYELAGRAPLIGTILVFTDENLTYRYETSFSYSAPFAINCYCQGWV
jgi:hypothetical protein